MALHSELAAGRWHMLTLAQQLANIGSEVSRAAKAADKPERQKGAIDRGLELFDLTLADSRWRGKRMEIARAREVFCDAALGGREYGSTFAGFQSYFDRFAIARISD
jgi:hypothetical protein